MRETMWSLNLRKPLGCKMRDPGTGRMRERITTKGTTEGGFGFLKFLFSRIGHGRRSHLSRGLRSGQNPCPVAGGCPAPRSTSPAQRGSKCPALPRRPAFRGVPSPCPEAVVCPSWLPWGRTATRGSRPWSCNCRWPVFLESILNSFVF